MKYMLALFGDESGWEDVTPEEMKAAMDRWVELDTQLVEAGAFIAGEGLQESRTATTIRVEGDERPVTDGPFAETKEQLGGFYLIECDNLDQALEWAKKVPMSEGGKIEVRPVMDYYGQAGLEHPAERAEVSR
jgi:hypothetical protein